MRQSLELYLLVNFFADAAIFGTVARANGCLRFRRLLISSAIGAIYAILCLKWKQFSHPAIQIALLIVAAACLCPDRTKVASIAFQSAAAAFLTGGLCGATGGTWAFPVGLAFCFALLCLRRRRSLQTVISAEIECDGQTLRVDALVDTGNCLHEPISGEPILILEKRLWSVLPSNPCRTLPYFGLGGSGLLPCLRSDAVRIELADRTLTRRGAWIALYPGRLPGRFHALVSPSFIE